MSNSQPHLAEGIVHHQAGRVTEALACYQAALQADPRDGRAMHRLGLLIAQGGDAATGASMMRRALAFAPGLKEAWIDLPQVLTAIGLHDQALAVLKDAVKRFPAEENLWLLLGAACEGVEGVEKAAGVLEQAVAALPGSARLHRLLGLRLATPPLCLMAGIDYLRRAFALAPEDGETVLALGHILVEYGQAEEGLPLLRRGLAAGAGDATAWGALANALFGFGHMAEAETAARTALERNPRQPSGLVVLASTALDRGDLIRGWEGFESRLSLIRKVSPRRQTTRPRWDGTARPGQRLLIWREEGLGDEIRFASCVPDVLAMGMRVIWECSPRLETLFARNWPQATVRPFGATPDDEFDVHIPVGSLPKLFRRRFEDFPVPGRFLAADPVLAARWRERVAALPAGLRIGMCWQSQNKSHFKAPFSASLDEWQSLFALPGITFVSLQYGDVSDQIEAAENKYGIRIHRWGDLDLTDDFEAVAALIEALDLVVTARTTVAALAGALGKATLLYVTDPNILMMNRELDPWFSAVRLFHRPRAAEAEGWRPTMDRIANVIAGISANALAGTEA